MLQLMLCTKPREKQSMYQVIKYIIYLKNPTKQQKNLQFMVLIIIMVLTLKLPMDFIFKSPFIFLQSN